MNPSLSRNASDPERPSDGLRPEPMAVKATDVLSALGDQDCRELLSACEQESLTAQECAEACELPLSTVYRKLDLLTDAGLLEENRRIKTANNHPTEFSTSFDTLAVSLRAGDELSLDFRQIAADGDGRERKENDR